MNYLRSFVAVTVLALGTLLGGTAHATPMTELTVDFKFDDLASGEKNMYLAVNDDVHISIWASSFLDEDLYSYALFDSLRIGDIYIGMTSTNSKAESVVFHNFVWNYTMGYSILGRLDGFNPDKSFITLNDGSLLRFDKSIGSGYDYSIVYWSISKSFTTKEEYADWYKNFSSNDLDNLKDPLDFFYPLRMDTVHLVFTVPEPQTYAMFLVGLGVVGFAAKRRRKSAV
jgi:hypothetical protein